ncbi:hypothetical protein BJ742DRAFT_778023 [Cladochytrium replicatum]|nr:hypothetical protein BJ742DRAFT_778023 [Cladochytrium replicatum]
MNARTASTSSSSGPFWPRLYQADATTEAPDMRSSAFIDITDGSAMKRLSIADPSVYKDHTIVAVAFLPQNSKLEHTDYYEQSSLVGDWRDVYVHWHRWRNVHQLVSFRL